MTKRGLIHWSTEPGKEGMIVIHDYVLWAIGALFALVILTFGWLCAVMLWRACI